MPTPTGMNVPSAEKVDTGDAAYKRIGCFLMALIGIYVPAQWCCVAQVLQL